MTFQIQCVQYNVWHNETFQIQCVTQWDISNTMCDNETFKIQCVTMRHLKYNVWQWDI